MEIRVSDLGRYGVPEPVLDLWRHRQGETLLPVQSRAVRQGLLEAPDGRERRNMLISAPTSAGKSFCAEMAAVKALAAREKVILLYPLKSLAEQQYRRWQDTYGPLGIRALIVTGDHPENDRAFRSGDYQLAMAIYEKLDLALTQHLDLLRTVGLIVVDEIQMIREAGRGAVLERLLTKVRASCYQPNLIALTGTLADTDPQPLADWLQARLVEESVRPRDLIRGVAAGETFRFRSFNGRLDGQEQLPVPVPELSTEDSRQALVTWLLEQIDRPGLRQGYPALVFLKSRADAVALALSLAARSHWPEAASALQALADHEPSALHRTLRQVLARGVAFHSADLSRQERSAIEKSFIKNEIKVICSTTTLSMGVDLPAESVFLETVKYATGGYGGRAELVPISRTEFENMTGRAGRFRGESTEPGQAVVLAESPFDQEVLWQRYIAPHVEGPIKSAFDSLPLVDWVLHFLVSGLGRSVAELSALFEHTYHRRCHPDAAVDVFPAVASLIDYEMIVADDGDATTSRLTPTPLGRVAAQTGLGVEAASAYIRALADGYPEQTFGWVCLALASPSLELPPGILSGYELRHNLPVRMLYQRFDHVVGEVSFLLPEDHRHRPLDYRQAASLKAALLLDDWRCLTPLSELEKHYQMHLGQIQALASGAAHLLYTLGAIIGAVDQESSVPDQLATLSFSVRYGVPSEMAPVVSCFGDRLNRSEYGCLYRAGLYTPEAVRQTKHEDLEGVGLSNAKILEIMSLFESIKEEDAMRTATIDTRITTASMPQSLEIDGSFEGDRFLVRINGLPIRLTGKSFKYLVKLAWSRLHQQSGWIFKEDIEIGFNQARYMYRMKNEICAAFASDWSVVENNRLGYYRLNVAPECISLNIEQLRSHPDYEVRSLFMADSGRETVN